MSDLQAAKAVVQDHHAALAAAGPDTVTAALAAHTAPDWLWRGMHPWHEQTGAEAVAGAFWGPFLAAMSRVQRRPDILFAGENHLEAGGTWVCQTGHLMGLFDRPFVGIRPTGRIAMLRYAEFHRVEDGRIAESAFFCDLLHLMAQAGQYPLPPQTGAQLVQPGPATHDGLLSGPQDAAEGRRTLELIERMIGSIQNRLTYPSPEAELAECWHEDMCWWGPSGIGATWTIPRYIAQHQGPFRRGMGARVAKGHVTRFAEGAYGGFFGWPSLLLHPTGGLMGLPGAGGPAEMRVVDVYRRAGDKLAENWIFIDIPHFLAQQGVDVIARQAEL